MNPVYRGPLFCVSNVFGKSLQDIPIALEPGGTKGPKLPTFNENNITKEVHFTKCY